MAAEAKEATWDDEASGGLIADFRLAIGVRKLARVEQLATHPFQFKLAHGISERVANEPRRGARK